MWGTGMTIRNALVLFANAAALALNAALAAFNIWGHRWGLAVVNLACLAVCLVVVGGLLRRHFRQSKEEKSSSPSQQPTSGKSQSPSPSASPDLSLIVKSLTASPNWPQTASPKVFQPERRLTPVVGFRSWNAVSSHKLGVGPSWSLLSLNQGIPLKVGRNQAICYPAPYGGRSFSGAELGHISPVADCMCGFYVMNDMDAVPFAANGLPFSMAVTIAAPTTTPRQAVMVAGAVVGWGRVVQHADEGWRAQYIQVIALLDCKVSDEHLRITNEIAETYGVPVVGRKALELMAKEYGEALPAPQNSEALR
jgi:hypothetical protein